MIPFPNISPDIVTIPLFGTTFALRWYAMAYLVGIVFAWWLAARTLRRPELWGGTPPMTTEQLERLMSWIVVGVIFGGRMGYVIFYETGKFLAEPSSIIRVWEGGMSFHGGFLGVVATGVIFARVNGIPMLRLGDLMGIVVPMGLFLGRIANFINAELWGRPTDLPWGVIFPGEAAQTCPGIAGLCARHPSQLYEALLEGVILGVVLVYLAYRRGWLRVPGRLMGLFIAGYGAARFFVEFFRQPDPQFVSFDNPLGLYLHSGGWGLTAGQCLSLPMVVVGLWFLLRARPLSAQA
ncbi:prolipoprotein diacylglyceryl transferase [Xinfangfangia sp. CPCC 101601]|uniref:Phosphatidylglycerol--prolipoprotein diacylglyceryl transferase n=1 Tax=Pseudogemmobacter lacusdianii TaxID=3069608 RepID=A0ABU0VXJ7_9RHOB|nr:prolipoprotein diacylglyceryl transferase [Xinfangfangia sp. CPCC 101601]MDQ2065920.1 prolipoprotein diacylglyceryl transferase [Xinfangfangia sp. CPCC 101601]